MKRTHTLKRMLCVLLTAILCVSFAVAAYAEEPAAVQGEYLYNSDAMCYVAVLTLDSRWTTAATVAQSAVTLKGTSDAQHMLGQVEAAVYTADGKSYPQLFVQIRARDWSDCSNITADVAPGAFTDAAGVQSEAVSLPLNLCTPVHYDVQGICDEATLSSDRVLRGATVRTEIDCDSVYAEIWRQNTTLRAGDTQIEAQFVPGRGETTVVGSLNALVSDSYTVRTQSRAAAYLLDVGRNGLSMLALPFMALGLSLLALIPGMGFMGVASIGSIVAIPAMFFNSLTHIVTHTVVYH